MSAHATAFAPGRVNLIGEHTDYNHGLALPLTIAAGVTVEASSRPGRVVEVFAADVDGRDRFPLWNPPPTRGWRAFVRGTVAELQTAGVILPAAFVRISGDVPRGAGLSSSAALGVALCLALGALGEARLEHVELARLASRVENDWVGARTGLLDQLASLYGQPGRALCIDFRSLEVRPVPLALNGFRLVTLDSGERHANARSGYNERRAECARAIEQMGVTSMRDASCEIAAGLPAPLGLRVRHVIEENARVQEAVSCLERRDLPGLGRLLDASHASLRDFYEVSTPAVEHAVERLRSQGAAGARIIGGGFGGHVLGLLPPGVAVPAGAVEVRPGAGAWVEASP